MTLRTGELFDFRQDIPPDILLVSANATITAKGALVMGRGAALQAKTEFPGCDVTFGRIIAYHLLIEGPGKPYGVLVIPNTLPKSLGVFQVKWNFRDKASLELIRFSSGVLTRKAEGIWKDKLIWMNFPGIWNGGLTRDVVWPLVKDLPDNVVVWLRDEGI